METKNFLFISNDALIRDAAWQCVRQGHNVKYCIENPAEREIADGLVPKVKNWKDHVEWADVIVFDDIERSKAVEKLWKQGRNVIGASQYSERLELDRAFGQDELKAAGVNILPYQKFSTYDEGIAYIKSYPGKYVLKPHGSMIKTLLFVGEEDDGADVVRVLEAYKRAGTKIKEYQLQKRVTGVEVAVGAFFNGEEFVLPINVNFEHKKLFPGNIGVSTGEMGTSMFWSEPNKLFNATLKKMEGRLREQGHVGYIDINCIVNGNGIYPLEFTSRFGYPTIAIQQEGMLTPVSEVLYGVASGTMREFKTRSGFQIGARICVPPFPFQDKRAFEEYSKEAAIIFKKPSLDGIHIEDVKEVNGQWVVTGSVGLALIVCGTGSTMKEAQKQMYNRINNILIPNMYYRTDIGDRWAEDADRLHSWGYLRET